MYLFPSVPSNVSISLCSIYGLGFFILLYLNDGFVGFAGIREAFIYLLFNLFILLKKKKRIR